MKKLLSRVEEHLAGLLLAAVTFLIVAQLALAVLAPQWASPLTTLVLALFFWTTLLGVPAAARSDSHLSLTLLSLRLPPALRRALRVVGLVAALAFFLALGATGIRLCLAQARWHNRFLGTWCPDWVVTLCIPLAAALSCLRAVQAWAARRVEPPRTQGRDAPPTGQPGTLQAGHPGPA